LGTCDIRISDTKKDIYILLIDEGSFQFFADLANIFYEEVDDGTYINCFDKDFIGINTNRF
jgi:hypothetical protein